MDSDSTLVAFVKRDCPTCELVQDLFSEIGAAHSLTIYSQDDPAFPSGLAVNDDRALESSWRYGVDTVPTVIRVAAGVEQARVEGWDREEWQILTGLPDLGGDLPASRPGCGSRSVEPGMPERLALRFGGLAFAARQIEVDEWDDPIEVAYDRGWSDGLPIVPPTDLRIARMLSGTERSPKEVVGLIPPNLVECSVEKVAINAVMAGCRPEYFPVVLASVEAALDSRFSMHGLLCTLWFSGPVIVVNGPITKRIGMNWRGNALGQGNRANATIGRALQLLIRNVGGGVPGEIDRSVLGNPGKYTFCFAEDETDPDWMPLSVSRGLASGVDAVTLFHGDGVQGVQAQKARSAQELARSLALALSGVCHPKYALWSNAILVLSPDHYAIFKADGWGRAEIENGLRSALRRPVDELLAGAQDVPDGITRDFLPDPDADFVDKFNEGGLLVVRAGGRGGLMSAIIGGWTAQRRSSEVQAVTLPIA